MGLSYGRRAALGYLCNAQPFPSSIAYLASTKSVQKSVIKAVRLSKTPALLSSVGQTGSWNSRTSKRARRVVAAALVVGTTPTALASLIAVSTPPGPPPPLPNCAVATVPCAAVGVAPIQRHPVAPPSAATQYSSTGKPVVQMTSANGYVAVTARPPSQAAVPTAALLSQVRQHKDRLVYYGP